jgi:flagellar biosynthesis protein FlhG
MPNSPAESQQNRHEHAKTAMAIAITSGKGGVGKTNITTNLGIALSKNGHKVCIFDADTSLANINILLGLTPEFTLEQFLKGEKEIEDILLTGPEGVKIIPSASGIAELSDLQDEQQSRIVDALRTLEQQFDYILIDTAAGISENVIRFLQSAQYAVVIISPEPTSLTDAFSLIKVLQRRHYDKPIYTLVNMAKNYKHSMDVFKRFSHAVNKYVHLKIRYLGYIPMDKAMRNAVAIQSPVVISEPRSPAARCVTLLTQILLKHFKADNDPENRISTFWDAQIAHNEPEFTSIETAGTVLEPTKDNIDIIQTQKIKEVNRILELTNEALDNQEFNEQQAESLLTHAIEHHLKEFGALPQQVLGLLPQNEAQEQLQPTADASEQNARQRVEQEEPLETATISTPDPVATFKDLPASSSPISSLKEKIDGLVNDAIRTKRELAELSDYLTQQYQSLYSTERPTTAGASTRSPQPVTNTSCSSQAEDHLALKQSIRYASAIDRKR